MNETRQQQKVRRAIAAEVLKRTELRVLMDVDEAVEALRRLEEAQENYRRAIHAKAAQIR